MADVTQLLAAIDTGDPKAAAELLPLVYDELRVLAAARMADEKPGQTLQPTALVHEAYLRLVKGNPDRGWHGRGHFFAAAAEAMRRILVESARRRKAEKRGGGRVRSTVPPDHLPAPQTDPDHWITLDEALTALAATDPAAAELAKLRLCVGLQVEEAATALGMSRATAFRHWTFARAWLAAALADAQDEKTGPA